MRKTTQSLYQPGQNKSVLGQSNKFNATLQGSSMIGNKSIMPGSLKKIQGRDLSNSSKPTFQQTISKLKSKPNQKVLQDQYIKGLQQQIKYLEYELKLLKDKQIIEREGVNQLDNFLKDQIPINENILAMKNKYNATKAKLEEQFKHLSSKNMQSSDVLQTQKNQIGRLHQIIDGHRNQVQQRVKQFKGKLSEVVRQLTLTEDETGKLSQNSRNLQQKIRKMTEQIANIQRSIQKEKVLEVRAMEEKSKAIEKFEEKSKKTKQDMLEALQKVQQTELYTQQKGTNPLADDLQIKNSVLRKKIMLNQKQKSTAQNIIAEVQLFMKQQDRQRQIERKQKLKFTNAIEQYKNELQNYERFSQNMIKQQTLRTKKIMIKQMTHDLREKEQIYDKLTDRLRDLQQTSSNLISDKKDLQDAIQGEQNKQKHFNKKIKQLQGDILQNRCLSQSLIRISKQIQQQTGPVKNQLEKCLGRIPLVQKQIQKKNIVLNHLNKQVQLLKQLKGLDLDHLHMISNSGAQMQNTLHQFIKNWEKLKSL